MKKVLFVVVFLWSLGFLYGQCSADMIDFKGILKETRVGYFVNQHLDKLTGVYASIQRFHTSGKVELANINVGYLKN